MRDFLAEDWRAVFAANDLRSFADFWQREIAWFEPPNQRRGGWSGVGRLELTLPDGRRAGVFLKRQENHVTKTWRHPLRGMATLVREFRNLQLFERHGVPAPRLLYFGQGQEASARRAILVVEELAGYRPLKELAAEWARDRCWPKASSGLIPAAAQVVRQMHDLRVQHNCLYGKHLFLKPSCEGGYSAKIIDLEKAKRRWRARPAMLRDLDTLHRHSPGVRRVDCLRFLKAYLGQDRSQALRASWRKLAALACRKV